MLSAAKYIIVDGTAIVFSAGIKHSDMVRSNQSVTGAGFVRFRAEIDEYGETIIKADAYGESVSLGIKSQEKDSRLLTMQIANTY